MNSIEQNTTANNESGRRERAANLSPIVTPIHNASALPFVILGIVLAIAAAAGINFARNIPPLLIISGAVGLVLVILVFQKPELGAYILIFSVFTNLSDLFTEKGLPSINRPLVALVVLSIFANYILKTGKLSTLPKITRVDLILGAYLLSAIGSTIVAADQSKSFAAIFDLLKDIAVGYCIYITLDSKEEVKIGIRILLTAVTFVSILGVIRTVTGSSNAFWGFAQQSAFGQISDSDGQLRYAGPLGESNIWGQVLVSTIPIAIYMLVRARELIRRAILAIASLFILLAMLFTESRGAILAFLVILILISLDLKIRGSTFLLLATGMLVLLFILPAKYTERIKSLDILFQNQENGYTSDESISGRQTRMLIGLSMFKENPFLGVGFANYSENYLTHATRLGLESGSLGDGSEESAEQQPHSLYIEIMAETGLFGIATFLTFLGFILHDLYLMRKRTRRSANRAERDWSLSASAIMMSLTTFLMAGFFLHGIGFRFIWVLIGLALAFIRFETGSAASAHQPNLISHADPF
jgi:O-antigen ligase